MISPESSGINPLAFPIEYFGAQVYFAQKWSEISGEDFATTLLTKAALYRRITENPTLGNDAQDDWSTLVSGFDRSADVNTITGLLYHAYGENPENKYKQPKHSSAFGYDYLADTGTVKIHFTNPQRGEKPLSDENMDKRRQEFRALLENVRREHPEAALLMSATWLRSTSHYRSLSPPDINAQKDLMSVSMKFTGNSVWGQFIDAAGNVNQRVYDQFMRSVAAANTLDELVDAFPLRTLLALDPIDRYYEYYSI
jgi:hypothetical protein